MLDMASRGQQTKQNERCGRISKGKNAFVTQDKTVTDSETRMVYAKLTVNRAETKRNHSRAYQTSSSPPIHTKSTSNMRTMV